MKNPGSGRPTRREFVALGMGAFVVAAAPGVIRPARRRVRRAVPVMGTVAEIAVVSRNPRHAQGAIDAAIAELRAVDRTMTRFDPRSDVGRANLGAALAPVPVSAATAEVVAAAVGWAERSDGAFDPTLGRATELWDPSRSAPPDPADLREFAGGGRYRSLELGRHRGAPVVVFRDPAIGLDLGGIAKGYGVDRAVRALREWGVTDGLVNVGGDLYALGVSEDGDPWDVGVRDPADPDGIVARFDVSDRAVATSGDYQRYLEHDGRRYHHLLDPRTASPRATGVHSVTVAADRCIDADAAGTAAFGRDRPDAERLLAAAGSAARLLHIA
jgi:thiamine biosynthesis lipoprotein